MTIIKPDPLKQIEGGTLDEGRAVWLRLTGISGKQFTVGTDGETLSDLLTYILDLANAASETYSPKIPMEFKGNPVSVTAVALAPSQNPNEVNLVLQVGLARMVFSIGKPMLAELLKALLQPEASQTSPVRH